MAWDPEEAHELIERFEKRGVRLRPEDDGVRVNAPEGELTEADRAQLKRRKLDLIAHFELKRCGLRLDGVRRLEDGRVAVLQAPYQERRTEGESSEWAMEEPYRW